MKFKLKKLKNYTSFFANTGVMVASAGGFVGGFLASSDRFNQKPKVSLAKAFFSNWLAR